jgi:hypothetical protein
LKDKRDKIKNITETSHADIHKISNNLFHEHYEPVGTICWKFGKKALRRLGERFHQSNLNVRNVSLQEHTNDVSGSLVLTHEIASWGVVGVARDPCATNFSRCEPDDLCEMAGDFLMN